MRQPIIWPIFSRKLPENEKNGPGLPLTTPLPSANAKVSSQVEHFHEQREHTCVSFFHSVHGGVSVPACTTDHITRGSLSKVVSAQRGLCPGWSVSRVVFVRVVSVQGVSVRGVWSLSRGESLCPGDLCQGDPPMITSG